MNIDTKRNVVIVGAGLAGLSIGAILAKDREKYNVTVYEKTSVIGGRAICKRVRDYQLDNGIHALRGGNDNPVVKILEMVGKKIDFAIKNSDGIIPTVYRNGKIATAPYTTSSLLSYPFLSVIEKIQLIRFVRKATREQPDRLDNTSISAWLKELGLDKNQNLMDHLKMFISIAFYCEPNFDIMSAGELVRFFQKYPYDTGYPIGGWRQIIDKLVAVIEDNQGKIITNAKVEGIVLQGDEGSRSLSSSSSSSSPSSVSGIILSGKNGSGELSKRGEEKDQIVSADIVILNVPLREIVKLIIRTTMRDNNINATTITSSIISTRIPLYNYETSAGIVLDIAVSKKVLTGKNYDTIINFEPTAIIRVSTKYDKTLAPSGQDLITAWMPIKRSSKEDKNYVEDKFLKLEKIVEDIVLSRTPHDHQILYKRRMVFDNVIGTYPVIGQSQKDRPRVKFGQIENLYLVGDAVNAPGIGGSSNTAFSSALLCAEDIKKNISRN